MTLWIALLGCGGAAEPGPTTSPPATVASEVPPPAKGGEPAVEAPSGPWPRGERVGGVERLPEACPVFDADGTVAGGEEGFPGTELSGHWEGKAGDLLIQAKVSSRGWVPGEEGSKPASTETRHVWKLKDVAVWRVGDAWTVTGTQTNGDCVGCPRAIACGGTRGVYDGDQWTGFSHAARWIGVMDAGGGADAVAKAARCVDEGDHLLQDLGAAKNPRDGVVEVLYGAEVTEGAAGKLADTLRGCFERVETKPWRDAPATFVVAVGTANAR